MPCAREIARVLMENSPVSLRATKKLLAGYTRDALERQVSEAIQENAWIRTTEDFREGIAAFLEKRKPVWKAPDVLEENMTSMPPEPQQEPPVLNITGEKVP